MFVLGYDVYLVLHVLLCLLTTVKSRATTFSENYIFKPFSPPQPRSSVVSAALCSEAVVLVLFIVTFFVFVDGCVWPLF